MALLTSIKGQAKKTLHSGKVSIDIAHYESVRHMFDALHSPGQHVSVMMLTVELKKISEMPVLLHVLSKHVSCWLASVHFVHPNITKIAQNTCYFEIIMQDSVTSISSQLPKSHNSWQCVINIDSTNIFFDMESR